MRWGCPSLPFPFLATGVLLCVGRAGTRRQGGVTAVGGEVGEPGGGLVAGLPVQHLFSTCSGHLLQVRSLVGRDGGWSCMQTSAGRMNSRQRLGAGDGIRQGRQSAPRTLARSPSLRTERWRPVGAPVGSCLPELHQLGVRRIRAASLLMGHSPIGILARTRQYFKHECESSQLGCEVGHKTGDGVEL